MHPPRSLWIDHQILLSVFFTAAYFLGKCVLKHTWNANNTRKTLGAVMLVAPWFVGYGAPYAANRVEVVGTYFLFLAALLVFWEPLRKRSRFLQTAFAAIDRPEDRPNTLMWMATSYVVTAAATLLMAWWLLADHRALAITVLFSIIIGDLLAGVVGYNFGTRRYQTAGLFTSQQYTRSIEGSACVLLTTLAILFAVRTSMPPSHFMAAVLLLPITLTLAEAKSPHTWDEPIMTVAGTVICLAIVIALPRLV